MKSMYPASGQKIDLLSHRAGCFFRIEFCMADYII